MPRSLTKPQVAEVGFEGWAASGRSLRVVLTGRLAGMTRAEAVAVLAAFDVIVYDRVTGTMDAVIEGEVPAGKGVTTKVIEARRQHVPVVSEAEFAGWLRARTSI